MRQSRAWDLNSVEHEPLDAFWLKEGLFWSVLIKNRRAFQLNQIGHVKLVYMDQAGHEVTEMAARNMIFVTETKFTKSIYTYMYMYIFK